MLKDGISLSLRIISAYCVTSMKSSDMLYSSMTITHRQAKFCLET